MIKFRMKLRLTPPAHKFWYRLFAFMGLWSSFSKVGTLIWLS